MSASGTYGCSLWHLRLQPLAPTVAGRRCSSTRPSSPSSASDPRASPPSSCTRYVHVHVHVHVHVCACTCTCHVCACTCTCHVCACTCTCTCTCTAVHAHVTCTCTCACALVDFPSGPRALACTSPSLPSSPSSSPSPRPSHYLHTTKVGQLSAWACATRGATQPTRLD